MDGWEFPGVEKRDLVRGFPDIADGAVDFIITEHFLEHITRDDAVSLLSECHRVLKQGGAMRICVPDLAYLVEKYQKRDIFWGGVGGWEPKSPARMINEGMRSWGHQFLYDFEELACVLREAGFSAIYTVLSDESGFEELRGIDLRKFARDLRVEAIK